VADVSSGHSLSPSHEITKKKITVKDLEGGGHELTEVVSWNMSTGTEESHLRLSRKLDIGAEENYEKSQSGNAVSGPSLP
jgi:hypothetical protein